MMANITLIHYSHQKADSSKLKAAFPAQRSATQAFVFAAEYSSAMSCQSQQLGIGERSSLGLEFVHRLGLPEISIDLSLVSSAEELLRSPSKERNAHVGSFLVAGPDGLGLGEPPGGGVAGEF